MGRDGEKVHKEVKETEGAKAKMEMDREMQKMRQRQSRSAAVNICQSLLHNKEGSNVWP